MKSILDWFKNNNNIIIQLLKSFFAFAIVYFMVYSGKIDLHEISRLSYEIRSIIEIVFLLLFVYLLMTVRWYYLLKSQEISISFFSVLRINLIGFFFCNIIPGAIGGDVVKAYYVAKDNSKNKTMAIVTIVVDRILGLETLMLVSFLALMVNYIFYSRDKAILWLADLIGLFLLVSLLGALVIFSKKMDVVLIKIGLKKYFKKIPPKDFISNIYKAFQNYSNKKKYIFGAVFLTIVLDVIYIYLFFVIGRTIGESFLNVISYFIIVPTGLLLMSIPITPAGIGVGQGVFYNLFNWFHAGSGNFGANIITIYQIFSISVNMLFGFVYLFNKKYS